MIDMPTAAAIAATVAATPLVFEIAVKAVFGRPDTPERGDHYSGDIYDVDFDLSTDDILPMFDDDYEPPVEDRIKIEMVSLWETD